jgi:hypothetical protein
MLTELSVSNDPSIYRLIYVSVACAGMTICGFQEIADQANQKNAKADVTGLLIFSQGEFLQVLEGPKPAVEATYDRISGDPRHSRSAVLKREFADDRSYPDWKMGCFNLEPTQLPGGAFYDQKADSGPTLNPDALEKVERKLKIFHRNHQAVGGRSKIRVFETA